MQRTKLAVKHSDTAIITSGSASNPTETIILNTDVGARTTTGATQNIRDRLTTDSTVYVGSTVKYVNILVSTFARPVEATSDTPIGILEYAFVCVKESETVLPNTLIGTNTLGDIATKMYRNECIYTGAIPCSDSVPNTQNLVFKIPKSKCNIRVGDEWRFYTYYRDASAVASGTDKNRTILQVNYKSYQ